MDPQTNPSDEPRAAAAPTVPPTAAEPAARKPQHERRSYRVILEQPSSALRKFVIGALLAALVLSVMFNIGLLGSYRSYLQTDPTINEVLHSGNAAAPDKVAIISVEGAIMESDGFVKKQIDRVRKDKNVKAIVLRVDSPGGTVNASHYLYHHLKKLKKDKDIPLVVSMGGIAASGGYYISMAVGDSEDTIFAEETTWTGSVGVLIPTYDISELLQKWDIRDRTYASGDLKQMGSPTRPLDEAQRKREAEKFQQLVDESFSGFKEVIAAGRPDLVKDQKAMDEIVTGQIFTAKQAYQLGLVDKLGYVEDAVERAAELAQLTDDKYRVIKFKRPAGLIDIALGGGSAQTFDLAALLDLSSPRAYYLATWLPSLAVNKERLP